LYKYAVANSPEFRDVVDEQFREAVLDPEEDVQGDALVLCCESCGAPSKFRCSICDRLVCAFCQLKQHAFDGVPPHYPSKYSPRYRRQLESDGRKMRLLKNQQEHHDRPWCKGGSTRATDERKFKQLSRKVGDEAIAGADAAHARLALTYGWVQSPGAVHIAVWVPGDPGQVDISIDASPFAGAPPRLKLQQREGNYPPAIDREFGGAIDVRTDLECVVFASMSMIVIKALKKNYGELWRSAFAGDALLLRNAGDRDEHEWSRDDGEDWREPNPTFLADVFVPENMSAGAFRRRGDGAVVRGESKGLGRLEAPLGLPVPRRRVVVVSGGL